MVSSPNYLDPETLGELKDLTLRATSIVDGLVAGSHRSPFHGFSVEFAQHREYVPGDDIRHVDWKIFGRTDKLHLKQFEDETNLCCWFLVDQSESMRFIGPRSSLSKYDYACCLAVAFAWLVLNQRDAVSVTLFSEGMQSSSRPSDRQESLTQMIHILQQATSAPGTSFANSLHEFALETVQRGVVVILSDCFDEFESMIAGLESVRRRGHQVILIQILDPTEASLDYEQAVQLLGMENGPTAWVDPIKLKGVYQRVVEKQVLKLSRLCQKHSILFEQVTSDQNIASVLNRILNRITGGTRQTGLS